MEFSKDFLDYLRNARALKLRQGEAEIGKTGAETGLIGEQSSRLRTLTPLEAQQMGAQTGLIGAQTGKTVAETESEYGLTAPAQAAMALSRAQSMKYAGDTSFTNAMVFSPMFGSGAQAPMGGAPMGGAPMGGAPMGGAPTNISSNQGYLAAQQKAKQLGGTLSYFTPTMEGGGARTFYISPPTKKPLGNYRTTYR